MSEQKPQTSQTPISDDGGSPATPLPGNVPGDISMPRPGQAPRVREGLGASDPDFSNNYKQGGDEIQTDSPSADK